MIKYDVSDRNIDYTIDTMYWTANRSEHGRSYNLHIFNLLSLINEDDYE